MGVRVFHQERKLPWTTIQDRYQVSKVLRGIRRVKGDATVQKQPITPTILQKIAETTDVQTTKWAACQWAATLIAFFCFLRKANVTAAKPGATHDRSTIKREDIKLVDNHVWIRLKHTKTIQYLENELWLKLPKIHNSDICPTKALIQHLKVNHREPEDNLFGVGKQALPYSKMLKFLKDCLQKAGYDPTPYAGHSLRRGGATWAFVTVGLSAEMIKIMGDWNSQAYLLYCTISTRMRGDAADCMAQAIKDGNTGEQHPLAYGPEIWANDEE